MFSWTYDFDYPRELVWKFVSDTERINRLAGIYDTTYEYVPKESGGSEVHVSARRMGIALKYVEEPAQWVEPEFFEFRRIFKQWPLEEIHVRVELEDGPRPGTTHLKQSVRVITPGLISGLMMRMGIGHDTRKGFMRAYSQAGDWLESNMPVVIGTEKPKVTALVSRRIDRRMAEIMQRVPASEVSRLLRKFLNTMPDSEIATLRPYELADRWGVARENVLRFFLHATREGLLDLKWRVLCPSCRTAESLVGSLSEIDEQGHCESCNIGYGVNFDRSIEAVFTPEPMGLGKEKRRYCHFGPGNTPFKVAARTIEARGESEIELDLPVGSYQLTSPQVVGGEFFDATSGTQESAVELHIRETGIEGMPRQVGASGLKLSIHNTLPIDAHFYVQRTAWVDDAVTAAEISSLQEFRDLFGSEVLAPGAEFAIQNMVFLFSDLVDSTAMYEAIGDATAFSLVRQHFDVLKEVYEMHNGALVKTIGDAIMAVFREPVDAVRAAIRMHEVIGGVRNEASGHVLALKIGVHAGPCIAMEANGLIDYFGGTVNMAARVQGKATGGELVLSDSVLENHAVRALLKTKNYPSKSEQWTLKGLDGEHELLHLEVDPQA